MRSNIRRVTRPKPRDVMVDLYDNNGGSRYLARLVNASAAAYPALTAECPKRQISEVASEVGCRTAPHARSPQYLDCSYMRRATLLHSSTSEKLEL